MNYQVLGSVGMTPVKKMVYFVLTFLRPGHQGFTSLKGLIFLANVEFQGSRPL